MNDSSPVVLICTSPKAGSGRRRELIPELSEELRQRGYRVLITSDIHALAQLTRQSHADGNLKVVIAAGGDGTLSLVVEHIPIDVPVLALPLGTENLMARYLGIQPTSASALAAIEHGRTIRMDGATANGKLFLIMCSCGFDAEVVRRLHSVRSGHIRKMSYLRPILGAIAGYTFPALRMRDESDNVTDPGQQHDTQQDPQQAACARDAKPRDDSPVRWAFVFNAPCYATGLPIAPWADPSDGQLDAVTLERGSLLSGLGYLGNIVLGRHQRLKSVEVQKVTSVTLEPIDPQDRIAYQIDGDFGGFLPVTINLHAARFTAIAAPSNP